MTDVQVMFLLNYATVHGIFLHCFSARDYAMMLGGALYVETPNWVMGRL